MTARDYSKGIDGLLWIPNATGAYESLWMSIQRFMYLNDLSGERFARLVHRAAGHGAAFQKRELEKTYGYASLSDLRIDFDRKTERLTGHYRACVRAQLPVRYCAKCLAYCYHSQLFQFPAVTCCPYHGTPLLELCRQCGKRLSIFGFVPSQHSSPFCCTSCGHQYVPEHSLKRRVLFGLPAAQSALEAAHEVILKMGRSTIVSAKGMLTHEFGEDSFIRFHSHALYAASTHGATIPDWLIHLDENVSYRPAESKSPSFNKKVEDEGEVESVVDHLRPLLSVLKSINRYLARRVRSICKHPRSKRLLDQMRSRSWRGSQYYLVYDQEDCPCCAVLDWWRASLGHYFALHEMAAKYRRTLFWAEEEATLCNFVAAGPNQLAVIAMDAFTSLSIQMHYRINPKSSHLFSLHHALSVDAADHKTLCLGQHIDFLERRGLIQSSDHLDLDVYAAQQGDNTLYCSDADGFRGSVSWSMANAVRVLRELSAARAVGPIEFSHWWEISRRTVKGAKDPWYRNLSERRDHKDLEDAFTSSFFQRAAIADHAARKNAAAAQT